MDGLDRPIDAFNRQWMPVKLVSFSVENYRSITKPYKLHVTDYTVLVGPNNEGKSNILKALVLGLRLLGQGRSTGFPRRRALRYAYRDIERFDYEWRRDFPVALQKAQPEGVTGLMFEFQLSPEDFDAFHEEVGSRLTTNLRIKASLGAADADLSVLIQGRGKKILTGRIRGIASFISDRIYIQYIPALRTSDLARDVVEGMLERELSQLERDPAYAELIRKVAGAQKPTLERLAKEISKTISGFLPEIRRVELETEDELRGAIRRSCRVYVDDGARTELELKGDGVKSLTAISLLRHISQAALGKRSLTLAVEEPESHLHPEAIHRLRSVLLEIASNSQVIITTHSPVLVDRVNVDANVIVRRGKAQPAKRLQDIRDALGVGLSDNLSGAYLVLLVEGEEDKTILGTLLGRISDDLKSALQSGRLAVDHMGGASNLRYKASFYRTGLCNVYAFLDNDEQGRAAVAKAEAAYVITMKDYTLATCPPMKNSELEDLLEPERYRDALLGDYGVDVRSPKMSGTKRKWSGRIKDCFESSGKPWSAKILAETKATVARAAAAAGAAAVMPGRRSPIDALVDALKERLSRRAADPFPR